MRVPLVTAIAADQDLAVAGAVQLDARIAFVGAHRRDVAEEHAAAGPPHDLARARVIRRVEAERRGRHAGLMNAWIMRYGVHGSALPGLSTSGIFSGIAGTHSECTPGELLGSTTPSALVRG